MEKTCQLSEGVSAAALGVIYISVYCGPAAFFPLRSNDYWSSDAISTILVSVVLHWMLRDSPAPQ